MEADSGEKAIEIAKAHKPSLILMDIVMPGKIDGIEATRIIKNDPETSGIIIFMLTAKGQQQDIEIGREAGADDYIAKPFSPISLLDKIREVLGLLSRP